MERIRVRSELDDPTLRRCLETLAGSKLLCYPTETFYALGIDVTKEDAREKLYKLKGRETTKELPFIASDVEMVKSYCGTEDGRFTVLAERFWPGPLTLVLPSREGFSSIAIRVSSHPIARQIVEAFGRPLVSTSANRSGDPPVQIPDGMSREFLYGIDLIVDAGLCPGGRPSTIVSLLDKDIVLIREGTIPFDSIRSLL